ncbi:phosphorylcholine transferase LicD [Methanobrevibacter sp.]|uniref:LicD family protein n=1 Tax=Methanobrevibacter sp. TaxID=66852 RepID=UPI0025E9173F|nr:LicD family protein [Methanobrevibacter sp.]MBQ2832644.1 LicD family protein [Methanobrevibacter sp.]
MDFSKLYKKLPKKIQKSETLLLYGMRLAKFAHSKSSPSYPKPNEMSNFLIKHTNIKVTGTLKDVQSLYVELLRFIDNICKKYDMEYCLLYGTLLGGIRHNGFIPWDDDCDILMMRSDYNKLIEILPKEISKHEFFKENCTLTRLINREENYYKDFHSAYDKEVGHDKFFNQPGLGRSAFLQLGWLKPMVKLDIFPFDYIKEESVDYYTKNYLGHKYYLRNLYYEKDFSFEKEFNERYEKLGLTPHKTNFIGEGLDGSYIEDAGVIDSNVIFPLKTTKFEGYELKIPNKPIEFLKLWFGEDYMNIPDNIVMHHYSEYNQTLFETQEELDLEFKKVIAYLKEINDNFE